MNNIQKGTIIDRNGLGKVKITEVYKNGTYHYRGIHLEELPNFGIYEGSDYYGNERIIKDCIRNQGYKIINPENSIKKL